MADEKFEITQGTKIVVPAKITLTNTSDRDIPFIPYKENFVTYIDRRSSVELEATTTGQVLYYLAQATDGLTVEQSPKSSI